ncbi:ParB/RepB/Spo0J family partition protein [Ralstonia sp. Ralssp110]|uniref:ParB/RepB/Spo0J family partition protein n=1 Tax=Ralstonia sp. Ralssp110 TaxID=3243004 RepID=UPI0039B39850
MSIYEKLGQKTAGVKARTIEKQAERSPKSAPGMLLSATQRIDAAEARAEELEKELEELRKANLQEIPLDLLVEVPGRRRKLSPEEYVQLRENLRHNKLVTPITVRQLGDGRYEVVSGLNRTAVFRELGRTTIPAVTQEIDDLQADLGAFYANLLQPSLPDYEKYLGFEMIRKRKPGMSHDEIADMAGISRSYVTKLMSFGSLPAEVHAVLESSASALGANAAADLAALSKQGKSARVLEAIKKIAVGELDQQAGVRYASAEPNPTQRTKPEVVKIRVGKATFCEMRRTANTLRIDVKDSEAASELEEAIKALLQEKADARKAS